MDSKDQTLLLILRDLQSRIDNVRDSLSDEIKDLKDGLEDKLDHHESSTSARLATLERVLDHAEHRWKIIKSITGWVFSGASITVVLSFVFNNFKGFFGL